MPDHPGLTVAVPTCNGSRHLPEALASIRAQQGVDFDLIVSDDRSDDDTPSIARVMLGDRARVSVNSERLGLAGNWNRCVELSRTDWVAVFHQDDLMRPGHLAGHGRTIEVHADSGLALIAGPVAMIDHSGGEVPPEVVDPGGLDLRCRITPVVSSDEILFRAGDWGHFLTVANPLRCSGVTLRKAAHEAVGGFDPSYRYAVDWDYWLRVAPSWGLAWRPGPASVAMRWHPASETHRFATGTTDLDEQIHLLGRLGLSSRDRKRADRRLARAFLNRSHVASKGGNIPLARDCLGRAIGLSRRTLWTIAGDPRLAVRMAGLIVLPDPARGSGRTDE